jgi:hypothetical protein
MARTSKKQIRMAELYVNGPEFLRGKWEECAIAAGISPTPPIDDPHIRTQVEALGGAMPSEQPLGGETETDKLLADLLTAKEQGIPWSQLRDKLSAVVESVASGTVRATAAQVSMLKFVVEQAKIEGGTEKVLNVVLLPTQGVGATLRFEEMARLKVKAHETKE